MMRRRLAAAGALLVALVGVAALNASLGSALSIGRQHIQLTKLCALSANGGPVFDVKNVTNVHGPPEDITVTIKDRYIPLGHTKGIVEGTISINGGPPFVATSFSLKPGETARFTANLQKAGDPKPGQPWPFTSAYKPDRQYWAHFYAVVKAGQPAQKRKTHEYCDRCPNPTTLPPGPTTTPPTTPATPPTTPTTPPTTPTTPPTQPDE